MALPDVSLKAIMSSVGFMILVGGFWGRNKQTIGHKAVLEANQLKLEKEVQTQCKDNKRKFARTARRLRNLEEAKRTTNTRLESFEKNTSDRFNGVDDRLQNIDHNTRQISDSLNNIRWQQKGDPH